MVSHLTLSLLLSFTDANRLKDMRQVAFLLPFLQACATQTHGKLGMIFWGSIKYHIASVALVPFRLVLSLNWRVFCIWPNTQQTRQAQPNNLSQLRKCTNSESSEPNKLSEHKKKAKSANSANCESTTCQGCQDTSNTSKMSRLDSCRKATDSCSPCKHTHASAARATSQIHEKCGQTYLHTHINAHTHM